MIEIKIDAKAIQDALEEKNEHRPTLKELAESTGTGYQTLSNFTGGRSIPSAYKLLVQLRDMTGLTLDEILISNTK